MHLPPLSKAPLKASVSHPNARPFTTFILFFARNAPVSYAIFNPFSEAFLVPITAIFLYLLMHSIEPL